MQINTAMIHPHTPSTVARIQELVMPSADQDMEQQKTRLNGAGIGSSTVAGNKSAVSYDSTQRLSIGSAHQSSTSPSQWKTYICTNPCTPEFISERPLSVDCTWYLPSKDYSMDSEEVKIELHKGKPRKYILGGC